MPFERGQHQLIISHRPAKKNRNVRQILRRRFDHQIGHAFIEGAIDNDSNRAVLRIVRRNKKDCSAKVRVEHVGMCDKKRSGETAGFFPTHIAHVKLKLASQPSASGWKFFAIQIAGTTLKIDIVTGLTRSFLNGLYNLYKFLLRHRLSSGSSWQILEDCSGGNSRPSRPSGVGGGTFLGRKRKRPTPKGFASRQLNSQRAISTAAKISWPAPLALVVLSLAGAAVFAFWRVDSCPWPPT